MQNTFIIIESITTFLLFCWLLLCHTYQIIRDLFYLSLPKHPSFVINEITFCFGLRRFLFAFLFRNVQFFVRLFVARCSFCSSSAVQCRKKCGDSVALRAAQSCVNNNIHNLNCSIATSINFPYNLKASNEKRKIYRICVIFGTQTSPVDLLNKNSNIASEFMLFPLLKYYNALIRRSPN